MNDTALLNQIKIASPCSANWDEMTGDERARFCAHCQKHVYNLSALTAREAAALVREKEGKLCARFYRRRDGTMLTADCPVGLRRVRERITALATMLVVILFGTACEKSVIHPAVAGGITAPPTVTNQTCSPIQGDVYTPRGQTTVPLSR